PAPALEDLVDEIPDEVGVEQRSPRLPRMAAGRIEPLGDLQPLEFDVGRGGDMDRLGDAPFFHEAAHDGPLAPVDAGLDPGIVADRDVAGLNGSDDAVGVIADEDVPVVDV